MTKNLKFYNQTRQNNLEPCANQTALFMNHPTNHWMRPILGPKWLILTYEAVVVTNTNKSSTKQKQSTEQAKYKITNKHYPRHNTVLKKTWSFSSLKCINNFCFKCTFSSLVIPLNKMKKYKSHITIHTLHVWFNLIFTPKIKISQQHFL
jgi:hypothetical protein